MAAEIIWKYTVSGVWGDNSPFNNDFYGGLNCAEQSTYTFRILVVLSLVSQKVIICVAALLNLCAKNRTKQTLKTT